MADICTATVTVQYNKQDNKIGSVEIDKKEDFLKCVTGEAKSEGGGRRGRSRRRGKRSGRKSKRRSSKKARKSKKSKRRRGKKSKRRRRRK
jgi:hypothetical protein